MINAIYIICFRIILELYIYNFGGGGYKIKVKFIWGYTNKMMTTSALVNQKNSVT
jgi:hypothetical protein